MRRAISIVFPLFLTGCGLPPLVTAISYALDGISFVSTGKSVTDHAISIVVNKDCALWRAVKNELVCRDYENGERGILIAFADTLGNGVLEANPEIVDAEEAPEIAANSLDQKPRQQIASADPIVMPGNMLDLLPALEGVVAVAAPLGVDAVDFSPRFSSRQVAAESARNNAVEETVPESDQWKPVLTVAPHLAAATSKSMRRTVLVVGSFTNKINARRAAVNLKPLRAVVVPAQIREKTYYRVVTGPFPPAGLNGRKAALQAAGLADVWGARLCPAGRNAPGCVALFTPPR